MNFPWTRCSLSRYLPRKCSGQAKTCFRVPYHTKTAVATLLCPLFLELRNVHRRCRPIRQRYPDRIPVGVSMCMGFLRGWTRFGNSPPFERGDGGTFVYVWIPCNLLGDRSTVTLFFREVHRSNAPNCCSPFIVSSNAERLPRL